MEKHGFNHNGRIIYYIDRRGKDASFERWRVNLYYAPHYASTHFLPTESEYEKFISNKVQHTYEDYDKFREEAERTGLRDNY